MPDETEPQFTPRPSEPAAQPAPTSLHIAQAVSAFLTEHLHPDLHAEAQGLISALAGACRREGYEARKAGR